MERYIKIGDVTIGKGHKIVFSKLSGFESGDVQKQTDRFLNVDGAVYSNTTFNPRQIEIQGHILAETQTEMEYLKKQLSAACTPKKNTLVQYFDGATLYRAQACGSSLPDYGVRVGKSFYVPFVAYLLIPEFYWENDLLTDLTIGKRENEFTAAFTLPCIFTSRTLELEYLNDTSLSIYPVITISGASGNSITIKNLTTGEDIIISGYALKTGEDIIIDCFCYTATNAAGENLLEYFSDFEKWCLAPGKNQIKVVSSSGAYASIQFREKYLGV